MIPSSRKSSYKIPLGRGVCVCVLCHFVPYKWIKWRKTKERVGSTARKMEWCLPGKPRRTARHHRSLGNILPRPSFLIKKYFISSLLKKTQHIPKTKQPTTHNAQDIMFSDYICLKTLYLSFSTEILRWHHLSVSNNLHTANEQHQVIPRGMSENKNSHDT